MQPFPALHNTSSGPGAPAAAAGPSQAARRQDAPSPPKQRQPWRALADVAAALDAHNVRRVMVGREQLLAAVQLERLLQGKPPGFPPKRQNRRPPPLCVHTSAVSCVSFWAACRAWGTLS